MQLNEAKINLTELKASGSNLKSSLGNLAYAHGLLLEQELSERKGVLIKGLAFSVLTLAFLLAGLIILSFVGAQSLQAGYPNLSETEAFSLVGAALIVLMLASAASALSYLKNFTVYPKESIESIKDTAKCLFSQN